MPKQKTRTLTGTKPKRRRKRHHVTASLDNWELAKRESAVTFDVHSGNEKLGTLKVGRGSIAWTPANGKVPYEFTWPAFADRIHRLQGRG